MVDKFLKAFLIVCVMAGMLISVLALAVIINREGGRPKNQWSATYCHANGCQVLQVELSGQTKKTSCPTNLTLGSWDLMDNIEGSLALKKGTCIIGDAR